MSGDEGPCAHGNSRDPANGLAVEASWLHSSRLGLSHPEAAYPEAAHPEAAHTAIENRVERVVIRDAQRLTVLADIDDWSVQKLLGGLTDEPRCIEALLESAAIFGAIETRCPAKITEISEQALRAAYGLSHQVSSWIWIDLTAHMVVQWLPVFHAGLYQSDTDLSGVPEVVYTLLPPGWRLDSVSSCPNWFDVIARRVEENQRQPPRETQAVLWGEKLMLDWVEQVWEFRKRIGEECWSSLYLEKTAWLKHRLISIFLETERADLDGLTPRNVLLNSRRFVDQACQYRRELWISLGRPPQPKAADIKRWGEARFGTVQHRIFFELFEYLLERIHQSPWTTPRSNAAEWLVCVEAWKRKFLAGSSAGSAWTRMELIALEKALMPIPQERISWSCESENRSVLWEHLSKVSHVSDSADLKQRLPLFEEVLGIDDSWDDQLPLNHTEEPINHELKKDGVARKNLRAMVKTTNQNTHQNVCNNQNDVEEPQKKVHEFATVWKHSYLNWDAEWPVEASYSFLVMRISFLVSEILMELHRAEEHWLGQELIARFSCLQRAGDSEDGEAFEAAASVFCEFLEDLTATHPELVPRLADLQSRLWEQIRKLTAS